MYSIEVPTLFKQLKLRTHVLSTSHTRTHTHTCTQFHLFLSTHTHKKATGNCPLITGKSPAINIITDPRSNTGRIRGICLLSLTFTLFYIYLLYCHQDVIKAAFNDHPNPSMKKLFFFVISPDLPTEPIPKKKKMYLGIVYPSSYFTLLEVSLNIKEHNFYLQAQQFIG